MVFSLLEQLQCPFCSGSFKTTVTDENSGELGDQVITCHCGRYPVVAGIPILKKGNVIDKLILLIENHRSFDALLTLLSPRDFPVSPAWKLATILPYKVTSLLKNLAQQMAMKKWRESASYFLSNKSSRVTARDAIYFFIPHGNDYFYFRFSQPRYLVALSLINIIQNPNKPILDIACGCGHLTRALVGQAQGQQVVGLDQDFTWLYIAKNWIAPEAEYVCCDADISLPFPDDSFSSTVLSDAFHYFVNKAALMRELKRLIQKQGTIIMPWVNNVLFRRPYDGLPLSVKGYQMLMDDMPHRLLADDHILTRYFQKQGALLSHSADTNYLNQQRTLSIVASYQEKIFADQGVFDDWPHARGDLRLNPHYVEEGRDELENVHFECKFSSDWYRVEHAQFDQYLPKKLKVHSNTLADLNRGKRTPEIERLIEKCCVLGMPTNYSPGQ